MSFLGFLRTGKRFLFLPVLLLVLLTIDCSHDDDAGAVTGILDHVVAGAPLELNTTEYANAAGNVYKVSKLEYILTDLVLERDDGKTIMLRDAYYRNEAEPVTQTFIAADVPGGEYNSLRFRFGVGDEDESSIPNTNSFANMAWPAAMGGGYHYMRLEGTYAAADGSTQPLLSHTGPSGGEDFTFEVEIAIDLVVDSDEEIEIHLTMDLNKWFEQPFIYDFEGSGMIMGNANAQRTHQANGANVFSARTITGSHEHNDESGDDHDDA